MASVDNRSDPIRTNYYDAVALTDRISNGLFYVGAVVSFIPLLLDRATYPNMHDWVLVTFAAVTIALFVIGVTSRLYFTPRAEDKRRQDFLGNACGVNLTNEQTVGYYNNDLKGPMKRIAAQVLENSHFSKGIALRMLKTERIKIVVYLFLWLICVLNRRTDLGVVVAASQAVFSEQLLAKWIRMEWLRTRFERTYEDVYRLFQGSPTKAKFNAMTLDALSMYETAKANAAIPLSSKTFDRMNPTLSAEWDSIKRRLNI